MPHAGGGGGVEWRGGGEVWHFAGLGVDFDDDVAVEVWRTLLQPRHYLLCRSSRGVFKFDWVRSVQNAGIYVCKYIGGSPRTMYRYVPARCDHGVLHVPARFFANYTY